MNSKLNVELVKHANGMVTLYSPARKCAVFQASDVCAADKERSARNAAKRNGWKITKVVEA